MGPTMRCLTLWPGLKRLREEFKGEGVEALEKTANKSLGPVGATADTIKATIFLRRELRDDISSVTNLAKTVVLPPKGHTPRRRRIYLLENVGVRVAEEGGVTVAGTPIGTEESVAAEGWG